MSEVRTRYGEKTTSGLLREKVAIVLTMDELLDLMSACTSAGLHLKRVAPDKAGDQRKLERLRNKLDGLYRAEVDVYFGYEKTKQKTCLLCGCTGAVVDLTNGDVCEECKWDNA